MRRFGLFIIVAVMFASLQPAHASAQTINIDIVGFQYKWAGKITTDPTSGWLGSPSLAGTPMAAPTVHRGDTIQFTNYDPIALTIATEDKTTENKFVFAAITINGMQGQNRFVVPDKVPSKPGGTDIVFYCKQYQGMIGFVHVV